MQIKSALNINLADPKPQATNIRIEHSGKLEQEHIAKVYAPRYPEPQPELYDPYMRAKKHKVQIIDMSNSGTNNAPQYGYGDLTELEDIDAFLTHEDRLSTEQKDILRAHIPSKELLSIMDKMDDETLEQFVGVLAKSFRLDSFMGAGFNKDKSQELISLLSSMSEEEIQDTVSTLAALSEQEEENVRMFIALDTDFDHSETLFKPFSEAANYKQLERENLHFAKLTHQYVDLLSKNRYSQGEMTSINQHLKESTREQSIGIMEMANHVKNNDRTSFLSMLEEADKGSENNIFSYVSKLVDLKEYTSGYESSNGGHVLFTDKMETESERRDMYSNLIDAYEKQGVGWMQDVIEHTHETPPQIQSDIWKKINDTIEDNPALFEKSDSVETWMKINLSSIQRDFENQQIDQIYDAAQEMELPIDIGRLTWVYHETLRVNKEHVVS
ncbi:hypothetical protein J8M21_24940 [Pseudoalteromonas luteoviolacea]|uniref:hypothetical protein n=1 Tax=Pseudoalteromonas luteoviolacea TaxID=43657 RepID=UPI001B39D2C6|nr:hypothetical protein [Pseudoalteromonas luteoviolacea]MBQ4880450.1 hypothetical protein [Pseudoalteromonas luteoviolacea]MBQ4909491.1 hypothetical protein [Pseudoalteromonas luteoviolacea]